MVKTWATKSNQKNCIGTNDAHYNATGILHELLQIHKTDLS